MQLCGLFYVLDDGIEVPIPVLLDGEESVIEFVDLPYNGVGPYMLHCFFTSNRKWSLEQ